MCAHREGERLVFLDQVQELPSVQRAKCMRRDVRAPPRRRDEAIGAAHLEAMGLPAERDLDSIEKAVKPLVCLYLPLPGPRQWRNGVDRDDPQAGSSLGQAAGQVELRD